MKEIYISIAERSKISAATYNSVQSTLYGLSCLSNYYVTGDSFWLNAGLTTMDAVLRDLLEVELLARKYRELWLEKFCKRKLIAEKVIAELENPKPLEIKISVQ